MDGKKQDQQLFKTKN